MATPLNTRFLILPTQPGFSTADGRKIGQQSYMAGNPKSLWMGDPLAVEKKKIRFTIKPINGIENHLTFAKTQ